MQHTAHLSHTTCRVPHGHGWEIAVILRNFRKTKLSKSKFLLLFFFFFFFFFYSLSTCIHCATRRLSFCDISKYRFPAFYGTFARQAAIFCTRMIQTWNSFSLVRQLELVKSTPARYFFCFPVKTKLFTPTHAWYKGTAELLSLTEKKSHLF